MLEDGHDIRSAQELQGYADASFTMIYTHVLNRSGVNVTSPLDRLPDYTVTKVYGNGRADKVK